MINQMLLSSHRNALPERYFVILVLTVPFDDRTTFSLPGSGFVRGSTVSNYAFDNNNGMFGVSWRL